MVDYSALVKESIAGQEGYSVDVPSARIKMDANESPFPPSKGFRDRVAELAADLPLNRYPEAGSPSLQVRFARFLGVPEDMIITGNGSDELIQVLLSALRISPDRGIMVPVPTFVMYGIIARNNGHRLVEIPLDMRFDLDRKSMLRAVAQERPQVIFLASPNNPTGNCFDEAIMEELLRETEGLVVIDEAYGDYAGRSFLSRLDEFENLVVLRTLSKIGMAALRVGVLVGPRELVRHLNKVRLPYNINLFSQIAAEWFLEQGAGEIASQVSRIRAERRRLHDALEKMAGVEPCRSDANFILFRCATNKDGVYSFLLEKGIVIKKFASSGPLGDCLRVTVGTDEENGVFLEALKDAVLA